MSAGGFGILKPCLISTIVLASDQSGYGMPPVAGSEQSVVSMWLIDIFCCWLTRPLFVRTQLLEIWITLLNCACDSNLSQLTRCTRFLCLLGPRPHVSGYFEPLDFFFPDTTSVHIQASSEFGIKSGYFWLRNESNNVWTAIPDIFESDDVVKSCPISYRRTNKYGVIFSRAVWSESEYHQMRLDRWIRFAATRGRGKIFEFG